MFDPTRFFFKWILPISTIGFFIGFIFFMIDSEAKLKELEKRSGQIVNTRFVDIDSHSYFEIYVNNGDLIILNNDCLAQLYISAKTEGQA